MVATRGQGRKKAAEQEQEPTITEYERIRDRQLEKNRKRMEELGLPALSAAFNKSLPQPTTQMGKKSRNKKTNSEDSDSSEYRLDEDSQGDSDDDDTESDEQPQPLAIKYTRGRSTVQVTRDKTSQSNMAPGGRNSKRVRIEEPAAAPVGRAPQTRISKRQQPSQPSGQNVEEPTVGHNEIPQRSYTLEEHDNGSGTHESLYEIPQIFNDADAHIQGGVEFSAFADDDNPAGDEFSTLVAEDNIGGHDDTEAHAARPPRKPRPPTKGTHLEKMTKAMKRRLPILVDEGKKRPNDPVQAAKFASECGVIIRDKMPVLTHWKEYKKDKKLYEKFASKLSVRLAINKDDAPTEEACMDVLRSKTRQQRYRLKQRYFNGVPANQIRTTSPIASMTDVQWRALVALWSDPKKMETCEKNRINRSKVQYHQTTGARSYVAHLHTYKQQRNNAEPSIEEEVAEELDAVEAFVTCHTSSKKGLSEPAREAVANMESLRAEPVAEGETPVSSAEIVSKVLSKNSSNHFLKSVGIQQAGSSKSASPNESELREELSAQARAAVQGEIDNLKQRSEEAEERLATTQKELEECKLLGEKNRKTMEETNLLVKALMTIHATPSTSK